MTKGKKQLNYVGKIAAVFFAAIFCLSSWIGYISYHYHLSFSDVAINSVRFVTLTAVSLGVNIYDPSVSSTINVVISPGDTGNSGESYPRVEEYFTGITIPGKQLIEVHNERIITGHYVFSYQPDVSRLREMRAEMELDKVVAGAADEMGKMVRLRQWVRVQFRRSDYQKKMEQFDALSIWRNPQRNPSRKRKDIGDYNPCHFFPLFYSQVMLAMGYTARVVHVSTTGYGFHGFTEVWSNQYGKWVSMDPDLNLYYDTEGIPQNMLEVHNARYNSASQMKVMQVMVEPGNQPEETAANMIGYHRYIEIADLRNDWLTNGYFRGHPKRSDLATLAWADDREPDIFRLTPTTKNIADMYWTLNQAEIHVQPEKTGHNTLALIFRTVTPNFSHFVVNENDTVLKHKSSTYTWQLQEGRNELTVYPVNSFGVDGIPSRIVLNYTRRTVD